MIAKVCENSLKRLGSKKFHQAMLLHDFQGNFLLLLIYFRHVDSLKINTSFCFFVHLLTKNAAILFCSIATSVLLNSYLITALVRTPSWQDDKLPFNIHLGNYARRAPPSIRTAVPVVKPFLARYT